MVVTRDHHYPPKPDSSGLLGICQELNVLPANAVYVGDFHFDLEAARRA